MTDQEISRFLNSELSGEGLDFLAHLAEDRDLTPDEKVEGAIDFTDLANDDLAEDETIFEGATTSDPFYASKTSTSTQKVSNPTQTEDLDLFDDAKSRIDHSEESQVFSDTEQIANADIPAAQSLVELQREACQSTYCQPNKHISEQRLQEDLLALSSQSFRAPDSIRSEAFGDDDAMVKVLWPKFLPSQRPRFMQLLPPRKTIWSTSMNTRKFRPLVSTKLTLNVAGSAHTPPRILLNDASSWFRRSGSRKVMKHRRQSHFNDRQLSPATLGCGSVSFPEASAAKRDEYCCVDQASIPMSLAGQTASNAVAHLLQDPEIHKTHNFTDNTVSLDCLEMESSVFSAVPCLDLNDSKLHLFNASDNLSAEACNTYSKANEISRRGHGRAMAARYDISNDAAYDRLKENFSARTRNNFRAMGVQHGKSAIQLQWPLYETSLGRQSARYFHRPRLNVALREQISFARSRIVKRKLTKGKAPHELFPSSQSLAINDNSHIMLLEYSEEYPMMLSNAGMSNQIVTYYRRRTEDDTSRPRQDFGELQILLPQDKGPMEPFGMVNSGQILQTIQNDLYRAPVFEHEAPQTDFLVSKTRTGIDGTAWYIMNIPHVCVVGQELPSLDVPGPHSRRITTAAKNRLKMLTYRIMRQKQSNTLETSDVSRHFPQTSDLQTRQKLKEFLRFEKDQRVWKMRPGETLPTEDELKGLLRPEDICLLDACQSGEQYLQDLGLNRDDDTSVEADNDKAEQSLEQQLAPWTTSRNYLLAAQGKAMLQLHGEGDPTGRGEGMSLMKTSMKGGFRAVGESIADKISSKKLKDSGGHSYNVAQQQMAYDNAVCRIWTSQSLSLASTVELSEPSEDEAPAASQTISNKGTSTIRCSSLGAVERNVLLGTEKVIEVSRLHRSSNGTKKTCRDIIRNPRIMRAYLRRKREEEEEGISEDLLKIRPGDDEEENRRKRLRLLRELQRLESKKLQKPTKGANQSTKSKQSQSQGEGVGLQHEMKSNPTQRKCANCGQVGHIKTNKKMCPMLNGSSDQPGLQIPSTSAFQSSVNDF